MTDRQFAWFVAVWVAGFVGVWIWTIVEAARN